METETVLLRPGPGHPPWRCRLRWRRSARARQLILRIEARSGEAVITLPPGAGRVAGLALLRRNAAWVIGRLEALPPARPFLPDQSVPLEDVLHCICHRPGQRGPARLEDGQILVGGPEEAVPRRVLALLRTEAALRIGCRVQGHAARLGVHPRAIRLKDPRSRWASCAADGTLAFSWRLVMAPAWVLDYVVAHEVAHLREMNHSERFWAHLARLSPHRLKAQDWLKAHGPGLLRLG